MYTILIPLGLIVKTKVETAISAFDAFIQERNLGVTLDAAFLTALNKKIEKFNLGNFYPNENAFREEILGLIAAKVPDDRRQHLNRLHEDLPIHWRTLWNSQCKIDWQVAEAFTRMENEGIQFVIFSETNETHYRHIQDELATYGIDLGKLKPLLSFKQHQNSPEMLSDFLTNKFEAGTIVLVRGNLNPITNPIFNSLARAKETRIIEAIQKFVVFQHSLGGDQYLTASALEDLIAKCKPNVRNPPMVRRMDTPPTPPAERTNAALSSFAKTLKL